MNAQTAMKASWAFLALLLIPLVAMPVLAQSEWRTVANNGDVMPETAVLFNSYNQPSVNALGLVVFRARSKGGSGEPTHGIYTRSMLLPGSLVTRVFDRTTMVPQPNNLGAAFIEFPSMPRIDLLSNTLATRGNSTPVWTYQDPYSLLDTRAGSSAIFVKKGSSFPTAVNQLGGVAGFERYGVPGTTTALKFDQFPGAPAVSGNMIAFKGNYTEDGIGKTGVFYRDISGSNGLAPVRLIANTSSRIPNQPAGGTATFGSTAPPSAALGVMVFAGFDNEDDPTLGGIYRAPLQPTPALTKLVGIGDQVPGEAAGTLFTRFGESLSFDGRNVSFWGAWGAEVNSYTLSCPTDGNKDMMAFCLSLYPTGHAAETPYHQGIFVYDTLMRKLTAVAKAPTDFDDFVYWNFSGKVPGSEGSDDGEPARWRSTNFAAVSPRLLTSQVVFKAKKGAIDGLYHRVAGSSSNPINTILDTTMLGTQLDPEAPAGSLITAIGVERDGFRMGWLAVTASMLDSTTSESWGGIYIRYMP